MNRKMLWVMVCIGWVALAHPVRAQESTSVTMGEVVVTAGRQAEEVVKVPSKVTVVTAEQIQASTAQNVAEVLSTLAGLHVTDITGNKRNYTVDLRGFGESAQLNALLLVDGRRVNLPDLSGPDWNLVPIERIARIEIVRGSRGTVLYGDNATGGVINIITKEGRQALEGQATLAYGSYDTRKAAASVGGAGERASYDLSAGFSDSDGYRDNSDSKIKNFGANLRFDPADALRLHLSGGYHEDDTRNPGALLQSELDAGIDREATTHPNDFDDVTDYYVKAGMEWDILSGDMFKLETSFRDRDKTSYGSYVGGWFSADTLSDVITASPQLIFNETFGELSNKLILGMDYTAAEQDYDSRSDYYGYTSRIDGTLEKENIAYYLHDELGVNDHLTLSGGYRYDRAEFTYDFDGEKEKKLDEEAWDVGLNYAFGPRTHVYGSFTRGFRYPVLDEQFTYYNSTVNTTLQPQQSDNYEIGATVEIADGWVAGVNLFRIETQDEIYWNEKAYRNENMQDDTLRQGAELSLDWRRDRLNLGAAYTWTQAEYDGGQYDGNKIPYVPENQFSARAGYDFACGLSLGVNAAYIGKRYLISDFANAFPRADAYTVVNAKVQYKWRMLTFFVDANNLFDEEYDSYGAISYNMDTYKSEPGYYPSPGFNVLAGVTARFGSK
jgi:iron complex outermembrane receptor protein